MTEIATARVHEALDSKIGEIRELAHRLSSLEIEELERGVAELEQGIANLKSMIEGLPHRHVG